MMGPALPIISRRLPALRAVRRISARRRSTTAATISRQVIDQMAYGTEGIYGIPIYVSSTYIFLFILFGSFLERAGMIRLFTDVSLGFVGHARGGAAKVVGDRLGTDGHDLGLGRRQCRHHRPVHHPADEALRLSRGLCRRRRGDGLDGRPDHAAGDGRGGLHHGRDAGRRILRGGQGGDHPGAALFRLGLLDGASGGRQAQSARPVEGRTALAAEGASATAGT